jgi:hypothetical protein
MLLFVVSLPVNLVALVRGRGAWLAWGEALAWTAVGIWLAHTLFSMITTYAAWGVFIAWFEPRTRFTFTLAAVGIIFLVVSRLVSNVRFSALSFTLLAGLTLGLAPRLVAVQHPPDAISSSPSAAIQTFYTAILIVSLVMGGLLAVWLQARFAPSR